MDKARTEREEGGRRGVGKNNYMNRKKEQTRRGVWQRFRKIWHEQGKGRNLNLNLLQILDPLSSALYVLLFQ